MNLLKSVITVLIYVFMIGCANSAPTRSTITLVVPDGFRGEIFIVENPKTDQGQDWRKVDIVVPVSGVVAVKDLQGLANIAPEKFRAKYSNGKRMGNSVLRTGDEISLWPITYVKNELLYFVVGTFHEKTMFDNEKIGGDWMALIAKIKAKL